MDHSLITAGRTTHLKIVAVALAGAIVVVAVAIGGHVSDVAVSERTSGLVVKAGKPVAVTSHDHSTLQ